MLRMSFRDYNLLYNNSGDVSLACVVQGENKGGGEEAFILLCCISVIYFYWFRAARRERGNFQRLLLRIYKHQGRNESRKTTALQQ